MGTDIVTGGSSGIGAATKRELISEGHRVIAGDIKDCGYRQTPMTEISQRHPANTKILQDFAASIPVGGKAAQPEEIAYAINFLLGPRARFVCGVLLFIDGGQDTVLRPNLEAYRVRKYEILKN
jgi:NAD(P)-dependent dehydrogenase (short-subunit alcohol dehydrogenase family)